MKKEKKRYCTLCGQEVKEYGNFPYPVFIHVDNKSMCKVKIRESGGRDITVLKKSQTVVK